MLRSVRTGLLQVLGTLAVLLLIFEVWARLFPPKDQTFATSGRTHRSPWISARIGCACGWMEAVGLKGRVAGRVRSALPTPLILSAD